MRRWVFILVLMLSGLSLRAQEVTVRQDTTSTRMVRERNTVGSEISGQGSAEKGNGAESSVISTFEGEPSWGQFGELEADAAESLAAPHFTPIVVEPPKMPSWLYGGSSKSSYIGLGTVANVNMGYRDGERHSFRKPAAPKEAPADDMPKQEEFF